MPPPSLQEAKAAKHPRPGLSTSVPFRKGRAERPRRHFPRDDELVERRPAVERPRLFLLAERFGLAGTLAPLRRASERPIAIACLRLVTFLPLRPLVSVPRLRLRIADETVCFALLQYLAIA